MKAKRIRYLDALLAAVGWADKVWRGPLFIRSLTKYSKPSDRS